MKEFRRGRWATVFHGSSCMSPNLAPPPIREDALPAIRRQHGLPWISAMPTNLYGLGDHFSPTCCRR